MEVLVVITIVILLFYTLLMIYYLLNWVKPGTAVARVQPSFSIIIPARNEETNIQRLLQSCINLNYEPGRFEIIVVNDQSSDSTSEIVQTVCSQHSNIRLISISNDENSSKKHALEKGILEAKGDFILTTDADCILPPELLKKIAGTYTHGNVEMIVAPVVICPNGSLLSIFQSLDFLALQAITLTGVHNLCNGANLTFKKSSFIQVNGYKDINDIASGDDVLLFEKFRKAFPGRIRILKDKGAIVKTSPVNTIADFVNQRIRWAGKWQRLPLRDRSILGGVYVLNILLVALLISSIFYSEIIVGDVVIKTFILWIFLHTPAKRTALI